jgi:peptide/nickel transport system permease protein
MFKFILRRLGISIIIVFMVSLFAFSLMHILPGDPARLALGEEASKEDVDALRSELNLDKPLVNQYCLWIKGIFHGNYGISIMYDRPVKDMLLEKLPRTISIGIPALLVSTVFGILFGVISAIKRGKWIDQFITFLSTLGAGTPVFWIGILLIYFFGVKLRILPIQGWVSPSENFGKYIYCAIMPVFCLSLHLTASISRQTRSNMLDVINQDYIRTARANGIDEKSVILRHALRNTLIPIITIIALQVRQVVGGSLMVEQVFNIPGIGLMVKQGIMNRDYLVVQSSVLIISIVTTVCNVAVDIIYGFVNPQIRKNWR